MVTSSLFLRTTSTHIMSSRQASHTSIRWAFDCSQWCLSPTVWFKCLKSIQPEERERINRFVFQNDAISSMVGRLLMRKLVVESSTTRTSHVTSWRDVKLERSAKGKPYVKDGADLVFNVSHHGRMTVLAAEVFHKEKNKEEAELRRVQGRLEGKDLGNTVGRLSTGLNEDVDDQCKAKSETGNISDSKHFQAQHERAQVENQLLNVSITNTKDWTCQARHSDVDNQLPEANFLTLNNPTHSDDKGPSYELGVDICKRDLPRNSPVPDFFRIMRRNFHLAEWDYILAGEGEQNQLARFYRVWALKESFVKATGTGITVPLAEMCFLPVSELLLGRFVYDTRVRVEEEERKEWLFEESLLEGGYCVAVALRIEGRGVDEPCEDTLRDKFGNRVFRVDNAYEMVEFKDFESLMEDVVQDEDEEIFYEAQDFMKKKLRSWDS
ncbi:hypothetical protein WDU94_006779 [Cyamophila willieti]